MSRIVVDERDVKRALETHGEAGLERALLLGRLWRAQGMTPLYLWDDEDNGIYVFAEETYGKRLN